MVQQARRGSLSPFGPIWGEGGGEGLTIAICYPETKTPHRRGLPARHVELLHDFLVAQIFKVLTMTVATGKRVPRNTHAPLTLPGMLSTAAHWDQSRVATAQPPFIGPF